MRGPVREAVAVIALAALTVASLGYLWTSSWLQIFLYNGDSIILPLVAQSLGEGSDTGWTFSSQVFLFPEGLYYAVSALVAGGSPRTALVINAVLIVVSTYGLLRLAARQGIPDDHRERRLLVALGAIGVYLVFVVLEHDQDLSRGTIATLFLTTTYYYGVILAGLTALVAVLWCTRGFSAAVGLRSARGVWSLLGLGLLAMVTTASNPLFLVQVIPTLVVALAAGAVAGPGGRLWPAAAATASVVGALAGLASRPLLGDLVGSGTGRYLAFDQVDDSARLVLEVVTTGLAQPTGAAKAVLWLLVVASAILALQRSGRAGERRGAVVFLATWALASPVLLLLSTVLTGSTVTRYLIPVYVFPLVGLVALAAVAGPPPRTSRPAAVGAAGLVLAACGALLVAGLPTAVRSVTGPPSAAGLPCLVNWLDGRSRTGAGSFWLTRQLNLYGAQDGVDLLQVEPANLKPMTWMINRSRFVRRDVSYLIVLDEYPGSPDWPERARDLGDPADVVECGPFEIYDYAGTPGEAELTKRSSGTERKIDRLFGRTI